MSQLIYKKPVVIQVGVTAGFVANQNTATLDGSNNTDDWRGWEIIMERPPLGTMKKDIDYSYNVNTGVLTLLKPGDSFQLNEFFIVSFELSEGATPAVTGTVSNGFDVEAVTGALIGRVGWRQTLGINLNLANRTSKSGRYFQGFHPAVTLQNIKETQEDPNAGDTDLNTHLLHLQEDALMTVLNQVFNKPQIIEQGLLYQRYDNVTETLIENKGKAVGMIVCLSGKPVSMQFNSISLRFDGVATFNLYLFNDAKNAPLLTKQVTTVANDLTTVLLDDWIVRLNQTGSKGGNFYLVYFQDDLGSVQAIDELVSFNETICYGVEGFEADKTGSAQFKRGQYGYNYNTYGLLPDISVYRDFTQQIITNAHAFDEAIGLQVAVDVIQGILNTTRSNKTQRITQETMNKWYAEVNQARPTEEIPNRPGLLSRYEREVKRLVDTFFPRPKAQTVSLYDCDEVNTYGRGYPH